jgi:hypothetical protein
MAKRITPLKLTKATPLKRLNYMTGRTKGLMDEFDVYKDEFAANEFENLYANITNPYANMQNQFAGMENQYTGMENVYEEGEVAMKGYDLQKQNLQEGLATTLDAMKESGNISGGNVQALANAMTTQSQQISAGIEQQEVQNLKLAKGEASRLQTLERGEASRIDQVTRTEAGRLDELVRTGEHATDMQRIKGSEDARNLELQKQQALLTLISGQISAGKAEDYKTKGWLSKVLNF